MVTVLWESYFIVLLYNTGIDVNVLFNLYKKNEIKHSKTTENQPRNKFHNYFKER